MGLIQYRTDSLDDLLPAWARLGPLSTKPVSRWFRTDGGSRHFWPRPLAQQGGLAVSRLDGRGCRYERQAFRGTPVPSPGPAPRIATTCLPLPAACGLLGPMCRWPGISLSRRVTSRTATLTRIVRTAFLRPFVSGGLVAGRRLPPCPPSLLRTVNAQEAGLRIRSLFQFRRSLSCPTAKGNIRAIAKTPKINRSLHFQLSTMVHKSLTGQPRHGAKRGGKAETIEKNRKANTMAVDRAAQPSLALGGANHPKPQPKNRITVAADRGNLVFLSMCTLA